MAARRMTGSSPAQSAAKRPSNTDVTYLPMAHSSLGLVAIMDWLLTQATVEHDGLHFLRRYPFGSQ